MILTAQEEFGVRCALTLARAELAQESAGDAESASLTLAQIADAEGLTTAYAGKIMRLLVQAGIVESTRGRSGGHRLVKPARETAVTDVLSVLGGRFYDGEICQRPATDSQLCVHNNDCAVRSLWSGMQTLLDTFLSEVSLYDLACDEETMDRIVAANRESLDETRALTQTEPAAVVARKESDV